MQKELQAIKDAWDPGDSETKNLKSKRDEDKTRRLADKFVADNPGLYAQHEQMSEEDCIRALEVFREAGMEEQEWQMQAWLFHRFEPRNIGGVVRSQVRIPTNG